MAIPVLMPTFGMTEGEATVLHWLKAPGQTVVADEPLFEAETEKASIEVPAPASGVLLSILIDAGQTIKLMGTVAWLGQPGETPPTPTSISTDQRNKDPIDQQTSQPIQQEANQFVDKPPLRTTPGPAANTWIKASPLANKIAREHGLDINRLQGSGPGGRILERDVREALSAPLASEPTGPAIPSELQALTAVRRTTARRMAESFQTVPHFYLQIEILARRLVDLRTQLLPAGKGGSPSLSYTALLARALALTLPAHPLLNAAWEDGQVRIYRETHLGVAVTTPLGLVVPVVHRVESLTLAQLNEQIATLAGRAREGRLAQAEVSGGTFTLTNLGMFGVDEFIPILNPPQSAILAAGAIAERPVGEGGQVVLRPTFCLTLAADHRVLDGVEAALFLRDLRELLEAPARMLA